MNQPNTQTGSDTARACAMRLLSIHARRYPDLQPIPIDDSRLSPRDAALTHALIDTVIRRWSTLVYLIEPKLKRPFRAHPPQAKAALLAGAAQLIFFDRLPAYAVLDETVEWVKGATGRKTSGFVNAVLRRIMECVAQEEDRPLHRPQWEDRLDELPLADGGSVVLTGDLLPDDPLDRLAIATGLQSTLLEHIERTLTPEEVRAFALHSISKPPTILNSAYCSEPLPEQTCLPHAMPGHHVFTGNQAGLRQLLAEHEDLWVQDPASAAALAPAVGMTPDLIVDVCAGKGTKTRQLRAMFPDARILATDTNDDRLDVLDEVFSEDEQVTVVPSDRLTEWANQADLVVLDVPCSNTGVLGRRPEARHRWSDQSVEKLRDIQRQIIADSISLLTRQGALLYATCSIDSRENDEQTTWIERWHPFRVEKTQQQWPTGGPGIESTQSADGGFSALLK